MKFNKEIREKRQELFNIHDRFKLIPYEFNGIEKRVYSNFNFSIFIDDYCNADCKFCVAQLRFENKGQMYKKFKIENDEEYFKRLDEVLSYIRPLNPTISITGGEPTISSRLVGILKLIKKYNFRKKCITTNGSGLLREVDGKTILDWLIWSGFDHLNISRTHWDIATNQNIMSFENKCDNLNNEKLHKIIKYAKKNNLRPRMSCLLLKDGVGDINKIHNYLKYASKLECDNVIFRETMDFNEKEIINDIKKDYCNKNKVRLNDIWKDIDKDFEFKPVLQNLGYYYYVEVYDYNGICMVTESADLKQLDKEKERNKDIVYEMIFHPNGNLNGSWVDTEDILLKY